MDFKKMLTTMVLLSLALLTGCTSGTYGSDDKSDNIIGNPTASVAALSTPDEGASQSLVLFDKTVRRIHQFDITGMKHIRSFAVSNPGADHYVLYGNEGNYIVDLSQKSLSIFNKYDQANHQPIKFQGTPKSAAFLPSKGLIIIYDDLMSVGMLKVDNKGDVINHWVGGASISGSNTIAAGDLNDDGKLVLALSDGSVIVVDPEQSMAQKTWVKEPAISTGLLDIKWLAPLPKTPGQILIRSSGKISLLSLDTKSIISSVDISGEVVKLSKFVDPHIVMKSSNSNSVKVAYVESSQIQVKTFYLFTKKFEMNYLMSSNLDLAKDTWSFVDTKEPIYYIFNDLDVTRNNRRFVRYRFSDTLATHNMDVANDTQVEIGENFIFSLFKRELGYAVKYDINSESQSELARFNLKYIPAN